MDMPIQNANPLIVAEKHQDSKVVLNPYLDLDLLDEESYEYVTSEEIFDHVRNLMDPEHPLTLEQLNVVCTENIIVEDPGNTVSVQFTPTIPHCSMATLIGLCLRVKLLRVLPSRFKVTIEIYPGSHQSEEAVNKQLNDKERVAAALENKHLLDVVNKCISPDGDQ
jgi:metal-sulfur cluster biosynthetic enzyme